ncbi:MAG: S-adenosylmethionine:tRNA ribosyltransferase-isomerase [Candidatus Cryptobacteroides sp.]|nr:S-adenosylmethionine:tRNA ribosyltransferase-isomerase [Bacteroidales bacterium]MDD7532785.1 S-adenosylmethionine:tRNA ribosyltransferase-isomerase [Bacteroidales bacterium]MDY5743919.1 S-adenosylmethionine:tRNA ribosyltransferase-isomerase [Candidatus Cryptobacteroides sp.]
MSVNINIKDYNYELPDSRIAKYPLEERDQSKLLEFRDSCITEHIFRDLPGLLPDNAIMVFNDTKVVPARLHFRRESGASIEVFCLEPHLPVEYNVNFASTGQCEWRCIVGNVKKWKGDVLRLDNPDGDESVSLMNLRAELVERQGETSIVRFLWDNGAAFSAVLEACGRIPIPPYLNRDTESIDSERYQTLYAKYRGSVAAPTAGLHFTDAVLEAIRNRGIDTETVCLHVGAGTFLPVKSDNVAEHRMHREPFSVSLDFLMKLRHGGHQVIAVGTTSVRTLESLYYVGVGIIEEGEAKDVDQWAPYAREYDYSLEESLDAIIDYLKARGETSLRVGTRIIIVPGFRFRVVDVLVTNFHQPQSTLLLLISAFIGGEWKPVYEYALAHSFRFLSYGDSSLLFRAE